VREVSQLTDELVSDYNVLIFGTATWGSGEAHDDWYDGLGKLRKSDLSDKKAMATLANLYTIIGL
jgi:flavodoxin I